MGSDTLTHFSGSTRGGGKKGTLGSGEWKREQAHVQEAKDSVDPSTFLDEDAMDTSETLAAKRERAPVEEAMASDILIQPLDKKSRLADLPLAFVTDKEEVKEDVQWRQPGMEGKIGTHSRTDPGAPLSVDGAGPALST